VCGNPLEGAKGEEVCGKGRAKTPGHPSRSPAKLGLGGRRTRSVEDPDSKPMCGHGEPAERDSMVPTIGIAGAREGLGRILARGVQDFVVRTEGQGREEGDYSSVG
jgi:hypothetical protein